MKKYLQIYMVIILFIFLASCKGQGQKDQQTNDTRPLGNELPGSISAIVKVDTISAINPPIKITRKIRKDKNGNLLIAAFEDVILYDGEKFSSIPKIKGFESIDAFDALEDSKGNIWIASTHYGVFRYDGKDFMHFTTDNGLAHNRTMDIHEDKAGNIWIATMGGASYYDGKSFRNFTTKEGLTHNDVNTIIEDKSGKIWFGTRGTASLYDPSTSTFTEITRNGGMPFTKVWSIMEDKKSNIWIGGEDGLWRYDGSTFKSFSTESVTCVYEDKKGNIWTTLLRGALIRYNEKLLLNEKASPIEIFQGDSMFFRVTEDRRRKYLGWNFTRRNYL